MSNLYTKVGNIELKDGIKINNDVFQIDQLHSALQDPILWNAINTYALNQFVSYQGKLYKSKTNNNTGNAPTNGTYWEEYSSGSGSGGGEGGNANLNALVFKIPPLEDTDLYHLFVDFSASEDFGTVTTYSSNNVEQSGLFKVFTGTALTTFPTDGVSSIFNGEVITFDISGIDKSQKYFRFYWYNGADYTAKSFGQLDGALQVFSSSSSSGGGSTGSGSITVTNGSNVTLTGVKTVQFSGSGVTVASGGSGSTAVITIAGGGSGGSGSMTVTNGSNVTLTGITTIQIGDNLELQSGSDPTIALITGTGGGSGGEGVPDFEFTTSNLVNNKLTVPSANVGSFAVEDNNGNLVMPDQKQVNADVVVDFTDWTITGTWKIKYIRGQRGPRGLTGEMSEADTIALIMALG